MTTEHTELIALRQLAEAANITARQRADLSHGDFIKSLKHTREFVDVFTPLKVIELLDALADLLAFHALQIQHLGRAEFLAAIDAAKKHVRAQGDTATVVHDIERMAA